MNRFRIALIGLTVSAAAAAVLLAGPVFGAPHSSAKAEARNVTTDFFRSINKRRYERTCALLSTAYYQRNQIRSRRHCVIGLRIGFMWSQEIRFRVTRVTVAGSRAVVEALADGSPGRIVLVRERGSFKVLSLEGA